MWIAWLLLWKDSHSSGHGNVDFNGRGILPLFSRVLVAAVGLFSRNFDSWIWFLCLFQHQRWLYWHVHTICCFSCGFYHSSLFAKAVLSLWLKWDMLTMPAPPYSTISTNLVCSQSSPLYWLLSLHSSFQRVSEGWDTEDTKKLHTKQVNGNISNCVRPILNTFN